MAASSQGSKNEALDGTVKCCLGLGDMGHTSSPLPPFSPRVTLLAASGGHLPRKTSEFEDSTGYSDSTDLGFSAKESIV